MPKYDLDKEFDEAENSRSRVVKDQIIKARVSAEERAALMELCDKTGKGISDIIRIGIFSYYKSYVDTKKK